MPRVLFISQFLPAVQADKESTGVVERLGKGVGLEPGVQLVLAGGEALPEAAFVEGGDVAGLEQEKGLGDVVRVALG